MSSSNVSQQPIIDFLKSPAAYGKDTQAVNLIETHGAIIFLVGQKAYKLKKAVWFPYMDYSTLKQREAMCKAEITLNRRTAPDIYRNAIPVTQTNDTFFLDGPGEPVEWLVVMNRFDEIATFDHLATQGALTETLLIDLIKHIVAFHQEAAVCYRISGVDSLVSVIQANDRQFKTYQSILSRDDTIQLTNASLALVEQHCTLLEARVKEGKVRRCHGDLHLRNICLYQGKPLLFDTIEFNEDLATIDVLYDLAFLLMDLDHCGLAAESNLVLNEYIKHTGDRCGLTLLPLMLATRAAIRSHVDVATAKGTDHTDLQKQALKDARVYLSAALAYVQPPLPQLIAVGGLSGSGKTTLARSLAPQLRALHLRSDVLRKQHFGVAETVKLPPSAYTLAMSEKIYQTLLQQAAIVLKAGCTVIVDAVFSRETERRAIEALALDCNVPFQGFWLETSPEEAKKRLSQRQNDASDADVTVRKQQETYDLGEISWPRIKGTTPSKMLAYAKKILD